MSHSAVCLACAVLWVILQFISHAVRQRSSFSDAVLGSTLIYSAMDCHVVTSEVPGVTEAGDDQAGRSSNGVMECNPLAPRVISADDIGWISSHPVCSWFLCGLVIEPNALLSISSLI